MCFDFLGRLCNVKPFDHGISMTPHDIFDITVRPREATESTVCGSHSVVGLKIIQVLLTWADLAWH